MAATASTGQFFDSIQPLLDERAFADAIHALRRDWPPEKLEAFLGASDPSVVRAASACLGMIGGMQNCRALVELLASPNDDVVASAEDALWRIWMRSGTNWAAHLLQRAVVRIRDEHYEEAHRLLLTLTMAEPWFAEPHHQRGLVATLTERWDDALASFRQALRLNPGHYAAAQGLGQLYLQSDEPRLALHYYQIALRIHPRLSEAREIVDGLQEYLGHFPASV